jgi:hypothetical protein
MDKETEQLITQFYHTLLTLNKSFSKCSVDEEDLEGKTKLWSEQEMRDFFDNRNKIATEKWKARKENGEQKLIV